MFLPFAAGSDQSVFEDATPIYYQLQIVVRRALLSLWRSPDYTWTRLFVHVFLSLFVSLTFLNLGTSVRDLQFRVFAVRCFVISSPWGRVLTIWMTDFLGDHPASHRCQSNHPGLHHKPHDLYSRGVEWNVQSNRLCRRAAPSGNSLVLRYGKFCRLAKYLAYFVPLSVCAVLYWVLMVRRALAGV